MAQDVDREWLRPEEVSDSGEDRRARASTPAGSPEPAAMFELRPLSLGEVLDRTFALYRSRFWMFASISAVSASVQVAVQAISLTSTHAMLRNVAVNGPAAGRGPVAVHGMAAAQIGSAIGSLLFILVGAVTQAATSLALSEVYLSQPASAKEALGAVARRWYRWVGIVFWQIGSMVWIPLLGVVPGATLLFLGRRQASTGMIATGGLLVFTALLGGLVAGFILYLRNALAVPAAVVERLTIRAAMRRSKVLAAGTKGRLFVVLLIAGCLYLVVGVLESPATLLIVLAPKQEHTIAQAITLLVSFVGRTAAEPIALIGLTLVYFDQRVRKEAFDLQMLLEGSRGPARALPETPGMAAPEGSTPLG